MTVSRTLLIVSTYLALLLGLTACEPSTKESPEPPPENAQAELAGLDADESTDDDARGRAEVIFQGLIAFAESTTADGNPALEAYFVNALPGEDPDSDSLAGRLAKPPEILIDDVVPDPMDVPPHWPFVAFQNATVSGESCTITQAERRTFFLPWESEKSGSRELDDVYPLCDLTQCEPFTVSFGEPLGQQTGGMAFSLGGLVDPEDFKDSNGNNTCQDKFLELRPDFQKYLITQATVVAGDVVRSDIIDSSVCFSFQGLQTAEDGAKNQTSCDVATHDGQRLAEQVVVDGPAHVVLQRGEHEQCVVTPKDASKSLRVWLFNVHEPGYTRPPDQGPPMAHHDAFYWYYNLAPSACLEDPAWHPRPCVVASGHCDPPPVTGGGDPKCPQVLVTECETC